MVSRSFFSTSFLTRIHSIHFLRNALDLQTGVVARHLVKSVLTAILYDGSVGTDMRALMLKTETISLEAPHNFTVHTWHCHTWQNNMLTDVSIDDNVGRFKCI